MSKDLIHAYNRLAADYDKNRILADITKLGFLPAQFDAVTAIYWLFHIEKEIHPQLFANVFRWLKPGGKMLFPCACKEYSGKTEFSGDISFMAEKLYYSHTTPEKLYKMLETIGFELLSADYRDIGGERFLWVTIRKPLWSELLVVPDCDMPAFLSVPYKFSGTFKSFVVY